MVRASGRYAICRFSGCLYETQQETALSDSTCRICGGQAPGNARYCNDCDFQQARDGRTVHEQSAPRQQSQAHAERGSLSIFLLVFIVASVGTIGMGVTATPGLSIPGVKATLGFGQPAPGSGVEESGELRTVSTRVRIRAERNTSSAIVGMIEPGENVRADHLVGDWYAVFDPEPTSRTADEGLGYVYAPLLKPVATPATASSGDDSRSRS